MSNGHVSRTRGCALTDGGCMRADRENNKGPGSLWGIPLCGVSQRKGKVLIGRNTGGRHPMEAVALSIMPGQLPDRVVYMQAAAPSPFLLSLSLSSLVSL